MKSRMKQIQKIMMVPVLALFLSGTGSNCQKEDSNEGLLGSLFFLSHYAFLRYGDPAADTSNNGLTVSGENMAGIPLANYGDGDGDYPDRFLTPREIGLSIAKIYAWRAPELGGAPAGLESAENADYVLYDYQRDNIHPGTLGTLHYAVRGKQGYPLPYTGRLPVDADRLGIVVHAMSYHFELEDMVDRNYQQLILWLSTPEESATNPAGEVSLTIRSDDCQNFYTEQHNPACQRRNHPILADSGIYQCYQNFPDLKYPCESPWTGVDSANHSTYGPQDRWEFQRPSGATEDYYMHVAEIEDQGNGGRMYVNLDATNAFFWDTATGDDSFDWINDGPDGAGKDMKVYLPKLSVTRE